MSDIKQAILDELGGMFTPFEPTTEAGVANNDAFDEAMEIVKKHLEGMVIVPNGVLNDILLEAAKDKVRLGKIKGSI